VPPTPCGSFKRYVPSSSDGCANGTGYDWARVKLAELSGELVPEQTGEDGAVHGSTVLQYALCDCGLRSFGSTAAAAANTSGDIDIDRDFDGAIRSYVDCFQQHGVDTDDAVHGSGDAGSVDDALRYPVNGVPFIQLCVDDFFRVLVFTSLPTLYLSQVFRAPAE